MPGSPERSSAPAGRSSGAWYAGRVGIHSASYEELRARSVHLARARLATFLAGAGGIVWGLGFGGGAPVVVAAVVVLLVFAVLVVLHARVDARAEWADALRTVNQRALARIARDWNRLPEAPPPPGLSLETHPYAVDLDIFGRASLAQWLGPAATPTGRRTLASWISAPADPAEILERQGAVAELAAADEWREALAAYGVAGLSVRGESLDEFLAWAEGSGRPLPAYGILQPAVYVLLASMWVLLGLHASGLWPNPLWPIPMLAGMVLSFATAGHVSRAIDRAGAAERMLQQYAGIFEHIESRTFAAPKLQALHTRLTASGRPAPAVLRSLSRRLGFANLRRGTALLHFPWQLLTLWDFHCIFALERWRIASGARVRDWFEAAGEIDALACLAMVRRDNPDWCFPDLDERRELVATALGHPLIEGTRRVPNDVTVGPPGTVLLVTGSNMSGKSTLLRAIGLNAVLAQCGAPVCASSLRIPPCDVETSIRIQDSLERGVSYFMAALARLKAVVDAAEREPGDRVLLYLLDEILQGTNSAERGIAVQAIARHLLDAGAIGAMTTHDLNIANDEPLRTSARLVHFSEVIDASGRMGFDYRLREGIATSRNALRLMQLIGIDV